MIIRVTVTSPVAPQNPTVIEIEVPYGTTLENARVIGNPEDAQGLLETLTEALANTEGK